MVRTRREKIKKIANITGKAAKREFRDDIAYAKKKANRLVDKTKYKLGKAQDKVTEYIKKNPGKSALIAAGIGAAVATGIGTAVKRRR